MAVVAIVAIVALGSGVAPLAAVTATSASVVPNSNLVEICMLTHTSASRSRASIRENDVLYLRWIRE
jgi:hypothetical protein